MNSYHSTRNTGKFYSFSRVILKGLAPDGGLFVPAKFPGISPSILINLVGKSYKQVAFFIFRQFAQEFPDAELSKIISSSYTGNFDSEKITPVVKLRDNQYLLELWHGPTAAFKDVALQIKPRLFSQCIKKGKKYLILVATSGDTGKAALEGYKNKAGISIVVFYPGGKVSKLQELSMLTADGKNLAVIAVKGNFDDTQRLVKDIFADSGFNRKLKKDYKTYLSSANSINWCRIMPQIVYHLYGYLQLVEQKAIHFTDPIDIVVPTGNGGNILAAFYAKKMGLPVRRLICASNANNAVSRFLQSGIYDVRKKLIKTPSPSINILLASNIERILFEITGDSVRTRRWAEDLNEKGRFAVDKKTKEKLQAIFFSDSVSNGSTLKTIKKIFDKTGYLLDPHTAVAVAVAEKYMKNKSDSVPMLISATAHWSKFAGDVYKALIALPYKTELKFDEFTLLNKIHSLAPDQEIHRSIRDLKNKKIRQAGQCPVDKAEAENLILTALDRFRSS